MHTFEPFEPQIIEGTPGLKLEEAVHIMLPGRGRSADGESISSQTMDRVAYGARLYHSGGFAEKSGVVVCSGYKTPAETLGMNHLIEDDQGESFWFVGVPEAHSARDLLIRLAVPEDVVRREMKSIDTVTNFTRTEYEDHFGEDDDRPVAIVAQESHLERMISEIAPRTLRRDYLGVVVPETGEKNVDGRAALLVSKLILAGIQRDTPDIIEVTDRRARRVWAGVNLVTKLRKGPAYNTEAA